MVTLLEKTLGKLSTWSPSFAHCCTTSGITCTTALAFPVFIGHWRKFCTGAPNKAPHKTHGTCRSIKCGA